MTTRAKRSAKTSRIEALVSSDRELLKRLVKESLQEVLEADMTEALGAGSSERTAGRIGYGSGYYSRGLVTRIGKLELRVPCDREGRFSTELFDRYQRSEKALVSALAEMYVQGVSTRKVKASRRAPSAESTAVWMPCCSALPTAGSRRPIPTSSWMRGTRRSASTG